MQNSTQYNEDYIQLNQDSPHQYSTLSNQVSTPSNQVSTQHSQDYIPLNQQIETQFNNSTSQLSDSTNSPYLADVSGNNSSQTVPRGEPDTYGELQKTNKMLGKLIKQLKKTEKRVEAIEDRLDSGTSGSSSSTSFHKQKREIPTYARVRCSLIIQYTAIAKLYADTCYMYVTV